MPNEKDDDNTSLDRVRGDRALARRSGFMARSVRELAEKARELRLADDIEVVFPDKNLEAVVRKTLAKPDGPLTRGHLKEMAELEVENKAIDDLTGLEHAVNQTTLYLHNNQISDVSPLASLTNLTSLYLNGNPLSQESIDVHVPNLMARGVSVIL